LKFWKPPKIWEDKERGEHCFHADLLLEREVLLLIVAPFEKVLLKVPEGNKVHIKITWEEAE